MRLILADDHNLFREALCYYLRQCADDIEIIEASDLDGALAAARRDKPDLILLDFVMPGMDGAKGIRRARQEIASTPVVVLSGNISEEETAEALRAGATSVISKELSGDALRDALGRILAGERIVAASSWDRRPPEGTSKSGAETSDVPPFGLTPRELSAVRLLLRIASWRGAVEEVAKADASVAWCMAQGSGCSMAAAYLEPAVAKEIFGDREAVLAWGPGPANAKATAAEGGVPPERNMALCQRQPPCSVARRPRAAGRCRRKATSRP